MNSELATRHQPPVTHSDEVLVRVEGVSKKFCRSLKKSLWYGVCDIGAELNPFRRRVAGLSVNGERLLDETDSEPQITSNTPGHLPGGITNNSSALRPGEFWAVNDVSFELRRGECLGLIGHNGAGKTTLLKMLNGLIKPDSGKITMRGRVGALIALGAGFNPILTGRENIYINGSVLGLSKKEIDGKIDEIIDFAEIGEFIDSPVQNYSSGMQVRLGFAVATAMNPDVLLLDEVLAVGDANFRSKCFQRIGEVIENCAVIFVSHDAASVRRVCSEVLWMKGGRQCFRGDTETGMQLYADDAASSNDFQEAVILADYVSHVSCDAEVTERGVFGGDTATDISVRIGFDATKSVELGWCIANVVSAGEAVVGQSVLGGLLEPVRIGRNEWRFNIRDLHLAKGRYSLVLAFYEKNSTKFVLNLRHRIRFEVKGSLRYGPQYAPIAYPQ